MSIIKVNLDIKKACVYAKNFIQLGREDLSRSILMHLQETSDLRSSLKE